MLDADHITKSQDDIEYHPLKPFLPVHCKVLFLGSFPPPRNRWSKNFDFFYPNFTNDHWRIEGLIFFNDRNHFVDERNRTFRYGEILSFINEKGVGFFDTASAVRRLKGNASDKFLEVVEQTDILGLLKQIPECRVVVTTGEKATNILCETLNIPKTLGVGAYVSIPKSKEIQSNMVLYRLPSSSRAYPLALDKKASFYKEMYVYANLI